MAKATLTKIVEVNLSLTQEEAEWLAGLLFEVPDFSEVSWAEDIYRAIAGAGVERKRFDLITIDGEVIDYNFGIQERDIR